VGCDSRAQTVPRTAEHCGNVCYELILAEAAAHGSALLPTPAAGAFPALLTGLIPCNLESCRFAILFRGIEPSEDAGYKKACS
jgi:hypothetical protein